MVFTAVFLRKKTMVLSILYIFAAAVLAADVVGLATDHDPEPPAPHPHNFRGVSYSGDAEAEDAGASEALSSFLDIDASDSDASTSRNAEIPLGVEVHDGAVNQHVSPIIKDISEENEDSWLRIIILTFFFGGALPCCLYFVVRESGFGLVGAAREERVDSPRAASTSQAARRVSMRRTEKRTGLTEETTDEDEWSHAEDSLVVADRSPLLGKDKTIPTSAMIPTNPDVVGIIDSDSGKSSDETRKDVEGRASTSTSEIDGAQEEIDRSNSTSTSTRTDILLNPEMMIVSFSTVLSLFCAYAPVSIFPTLNLSPETNGWLFGIYPLTMVLSSPVSFALINFPELQRLLIMIGLVCSFVVCLLYLVAFWPGNVDANKTAALPQDVTTVSLLTLCCCFAARVINGLGTNLIVSHGLSHLKTVFVSADELSRSRAFVYASMGQYFGVNVGPTMGGLLFELDPRAPFGILAGLILIMIAAMCVCRSAGTQSVGEVEAGGGQGMTSGWRLPNDAVDRPTPTSTDRFGPGDDSRRGDTPARTPSNPSSEFESRIMSTSSIEAAREISSLEFLQEPRILSILLVRSLGRS